MLAKVLSCAVVGLDGLIVEVEVDISAGLPALNIVGLPDTALQEARERVRSAVRNSGFSFPAKRITVNLAPADLKKAGPAYDLPIAIGIILASGQTHGETNKAVFLGELSLNESLRHTQGILPMVSVARERGLNTVFVPKEDAAEAALIEGITVYPTQSLAQLHTHLTQERLIEPFITQITLDMGTSPQDAEISEIKGQEHAKRAAEIAAAGNHNLLMSGPPGGGKTMLARIIPSLIPPLSFKEIIEVTKIYSIAGLLAKDTPLITRRPFRSPHYTISNAGLIGGGQVPRPGEITLSHRGVLFMDEFPEFSHSALESLRQPLEDRHVTISRAQGSISYPANFMLVAAMNPCPCGYYGDNRRACKCSSAEIVRYRKKVSGPLLDRFDLFIEVPRVEYEKLVAKHQTESGKRVAERVNNARLIQTQRFKESNESTNSDMTAAAIKKHCKLESEAEELMKTVSKQLSLTARGFHRVLRVSRTIADIDGSESIKINHLAEALQYRPRNPDF